MQHLVPLRRKDQPLREEKISPLHGAGGEMMEKLLRERILIHFEDCHAGRIGLTELDDGATVEIPTEGEVVITTDSHVVKPIFFPGGDIGRLAAAGTLNDLTVMGARPLALTLALIVEEGFPLDSLDRILASFSATLAEAGAVLVTGDTKVMGHGEIDGIAINTAGIGLLRPDANLAMARIAPGDAILINGPIAEHGLSVMSVRAGISFDSDLRSDVAPLNGLVAAMLDTGGDIRFLRDATRGGVAGVLVDITESRGVSVELDEARVPVSPTARHAAEMLGLDLLTVANEGKLVCVVAAEDADRVLAAMRSHPTGQGAAQVGIVTPTVPPLVELITRAGGRRIVRRPYGEELPRIC